MIHDRNYREDKRHSGELGYKSAALGIMILLVGLLLLARNTGWIDQDTSRIIFSWPMILVAIGLINLFGKGSVGGLIMIIVGGFFLLHKFYNLPLYVGEVFWPVLIVIAGIALIFGSFHIGKGHLFKVSNNDEEFIEEVAIFGGSERKIVSQNFRGGKVVAIFGGSTLDLTRSNLAQEVCQVEMVAIFGGLTLIVPSDWNVKTEIVNVFGGFADKRVISQVDVKKTVIIKGVAFFGGGEVKNFL